MEAAIRFDLDQVKKDSVLILSEGCTGLLVALLQDWDFLALTQTYSVDGTNLVSSWPPGELGRQGDQ